MAYAKLALVHNNMVSYDKRDEFAKRALAQTDRLTTRERYYIEGLLLPPTRDGGAKHRGVSAGAETSPGAPGITAQPGAGVHANPTSYENLSGMLIETGNVRRARDVTDDFIRRYPENAAGLRMLGATLIAEGRLDEARAAFEKSEALDPADAAVRIGNAWSPSSSSDGLTCGRRTRR
ncbi:hypothetical protein BH18ACI5_BH18ACI5_22520 [soil metagenome]